MIKDMTESLKGLLEEFKERFGYELVKKNDDLDYILFRRTVERGCTHELIIKDNRWERGEKDFNPKTDVGDWFIYSMLKFRRFIDAQYPLTYSEYKMIEKIINELEDNQIKKEEENMERIDEIIAMFEKAVCPKNYKSCPLYQYNDCDNYCPFIEAADMLRELKNEKEKKSGND